MLSKARKKRQKQKASEYRNRLKLELRECQESLDKERKLCSILQRYVSSVIASYSLKLCTLWICVATYPPPDNLLVSTDFFLILQAM